MNSSSPLLQVSIREKTAQLLLNLMNEMQTEDGGAVLSRALGLLHLALHAKKSGKDIWIVDQITGEKSEIAP